MPAVAQIGRERVGYTQVPTGEFGVLNNREATEKFKLADKLYRARQYEEALQVLDELDVHFPGTRHVMFPRARCLSKLDRTTEAMYLLREVVEKYKYAPAEELLNYLSVLQTTPLESDHPLPPPEPEDGGLGEPQAEEGDSPFSAHDVDQGDNESPFAPIPLPGAVAKPTHNPMDQLDMMAGAGMPGAEIPGVDIPGVEGAPEMGLLDNLHGGGVDLSALDTTALDDIDPATVPIEEDLFSRGGPTAPKPAADTGSNTNWTLIIGIAAIVLLVIGLGVFAAFAPSSSSGDEIQVAQNDQAAQQQPAPTRTGTRANRSIR